MGGKGHLQMLGRSSLGAFFASQIYFFFLCGLQRLLGDLWQRLSHSRKKLLEIFHILLNQICLLPVLESR